VARVVRDYRPDVLLGTWAYPDAVAVAMLARRLALPWVAKVHGSDINRLAAAPLVRAQIRWALRQAHCTFAVSAPLKQRLVEIGIPAAAVRVQHNGVDVHRFRLQEKQALRRAMNLPLDRRIVLYVGNLKVSKGVRDLLEATRLLAARGVDLPQVLFVGGGADHATLADRIRDHALDRCVTLAGPKPHAEIPDWMGAADLLCLPSHQEGCPNVVLEALACGRPVVVSNVGAAPEFIDPTRGALVAPKAPEQLADALQRVLGRNWEARRLREHVLPLSWEANARALARELRRAVDGTERDGRIEDGGAGTEEGARPCAISR
jgi:glycosyltransferase involved in cell wall biosynthesis